jgi:hypothetical protein
VKAKARCLWGLQGGVCLLSLSFNTRIASHSSSTHPSRALQTRPSSRLQPAAWLVVRPHRVLCSDSWQWSGSSCCLHDSVYVHALVRGRPRLEELQHCGTPQNKPALLPPGRLLWHRLAARVASISNKATPPTPHPPYSATSLACIWHCGCCGWCCSTPATAPVLHAVMCVPLYGIYTAAWNSYTQSPTRARRVPSKCVQPHLPVQNQKQPRGNKSGKLLPRPAAPITNTHAHPREAHTPHTCNTN